MYICIYIYIYTRVDPCIKCTRSKLDTGQGVLGLVAPEDLLSACCLVLPLLLSAPASSCPFPTGLIFVGLPGLSWAVPGMLLAPPGAPWAPSCSWACPGRLLGLFWGPLSPPLGLLGGSWQPEPTFHGTLQKLLFVAFVLSVFGPPGPLLGGSWALWGRLGLAWASFASEAAPPHGTHFRSSQKAV